MRRARIPRRIPFTVIWLNLAALVLPLALGRVAVAGEAKGKESIDKIKAHYQAAAAAYDDGDFEKTKSQLQEAISLGKGAGASAGKILAQSYLLFGVLEVAGFKDVDSGVRNFAKALDLSPAIQVPPSMATKDVLAAFERAENQTPPPAETATVHEGRVSESAAPEKSNESDADQERAAPAAAAAPTEKKRPEPAARERDKREREERDKLVDELAQAKIGQSQSEADKRKLQQDLQDRDRQLAETKGRLAQVEKEKREQEQQLTESRDRVQVMNKEKPDKDRQLGETKARAAQLEKDKQEQERQLATTKDAARKEGETNDKLRKEKLESDRQLADAKARLQQVTKEKQDTDQQLAAARETIKRDRDVNDRAAKAKLESDRQLADARARLQQLTREKQDTDRQLATTRDEEKKEHDSREKLEKVWQDSQTRDKERRSHDEQARLEREKLADGPALPSHFAEPIYCTVPDEIPAGADLFVHCVPHPNVNAKVVALYYRAGGTVLYNATTMERSKKGWYTALIPGARVSGKLLHYYVEARDGRQLVAASNGKAAAPNIAMIRPPHGN